AEESGGENGARQGGSIGLGFAIPINQGKRVASASLRSTSLRSVWSAASSLGTFVLNRFLRFAPA
ncbi:hypothetical protein AB0447_35420, partial [Streptomyces sp. NPDC051211]